MDDARAHLQRFLDAIGLRDDPELEGTAERVTELLSSFRPTPLPAPTVCAAPAGGTPVVVSGVPFHSMCAHHLLPFFGVASVAYRPRRTLLGLGAIPRVVGALAQRPQLQERLAEQIADAIVDWADPVSVVVALRARHLCVEMRGARSPADVLVVASRGEPDPWLLERVTAA